MKRYDPSDPEISYIICDDCKSYIGPISTDLTRITEEGIEFMDNVLIGQFGWSIVTEKDGPDKHYCKYCTHKREKRA